MFKSIKTGVLAAILISTTIVAYAQKKITEGSVIYGTAYDLKPEQQALASMLPAESKVKFNGSLSKMEMEQGPAMITIITNVGEKTGLLLIDVPVAQKQMAVKMTKADIEKEEKDIPKYSDFKATGEKQNIGGFNAEKYTYKDDKGENHDLWATTEIEVPTLSTTALFKDLKAFPVKFTITQNGLKSTLTLKSIKEEKIGSLSLAIPSGYEEMTMDELKAMRGGN